MRIVLLSFLVLCSIFACSHSEDNFLFKLKANNLEALLENQIYLVLPGAGCDGCISSAEQFVLNGAGEFQEYLTIIFTRFDSKKSILIRVNYDETILSKSVFDSKNIYSSKLETSIYPKFHLVKSGKLVNTSMISPSNPQALDELIEILNRFQVEK